MYAKAVELSRNAKLGLVHATYASQESCPSSCPLRDNGCYAESGHTAFQTRRLNQASVGASPLDVARAEAEAIRGTLSGRLDLRLHVVGDCATSEAAATVAEAALSTLKPGRRAWSYTHAAADVERAAWGKVSVLASCETPTQVKAAQDAGWATAIILPQFAQDGLHEVAGLKVLPCVNQTRGVQCVDCRLCFNDARLRDKGITIAFTPHGSGAKRVAKALPVLT